MERGHNYYGDEPNPRAFWIGLAILAGAIAISFWR